MAIAHNAFELVRKEDFQTYAFGLRSFFQQKEMIQPDGRILLADGVFTRYTSQRGGTQEFYGTSEAIEQKFAEALASCHQLSLIDVSARSAEPSLRSTEERLLVDENAIQSVVTSENPLSLSEGSNVVIELPQAFYKEGDHDQYFNTLQLILTPSNGPSFTAHEMADVEARALKGRKNPRSPLNTIASTFRKSQNDLAISFAATLARKSSLIGLAGESVSFFARREHFVVEEMGISGNSVRTVTYADHGDGSGSGSTLPIRFASRDAARNAFQKLIAEIRQDRPAGPMVPSGHFNLT